MNPTPNPQRFDLDLSTQTDQRWQFQRVDENGDPLIPSSAQAQIRDRPNGGLWATLACAVDEDGVITITAARSLTADADTWSKRTKGVWDLVATYGSDRIRVVQGVVNVDPEVTQWV